jgi:hypothetical protein
MTFGTFRWWGCQLHVSAAFTPRKCSWYSFLLGLSRPQGHRTVGRNMSLKNPVTPPGIDPGTVPLVAQRLNHYTTPCPASGCVLSSIRTLIIGTKVVSETLVYWSAWRGCRSKCTWLSLVTMKQQYICNTDRIVVCILFRLQEPIWFILTIYVFTKSAAVTLLPAWRVCVLYLSASDVVAVCQPCVYVISCLWISSLCSSTCMMRS